MSVHLSAAHLAMVVSPAEQRRRVQAARAHLFPPPQPVIASAAPEPEPEPEQQLVKLHVSAPPISDDDRDLPLDRRLAISFEHIGLREQTIDRMQRVSAVAYNTTVRDIQGEMRFANVVAARHLCCCLLWLATNLSYPAIGKAVGKDSSSALSAVHKKRDSVRQALIDAGLDYLILKDRRTLR